MVENVFRAVEENVTHEIHLIFDHLDQLRTRIHTLTVSIRKCEDFFFEDDIKELLSYEIHLIRTERDIRKHDQLLVEIETQMDTWKTKTKEVECGNLNSKLKYAVELKENGVIAIRQLDSLAIVQCRHPKHQFIVLYTSQELRLASSNTWITVYFEFLHHIQFQDKSSSNRTNTKLVNEL